MNEILTVHVNIDGAFEVKGSESSVCMVAFSGTADGPYFRGTILPGGVDTQTRAAGCPARLSARYMLEGTDDTGKPCRLFIENNGEEIEGEMFTKPLIVTDSSSLSWMEKAKLHGMVEGMPNGVRIHIYRT